ncbi:hypothetical protein JCM10599A_65360 [Paraburkholderia kururiensis]
MGVAGAAREGAEDVGGGLAALGGACGERGQEEAGGVREHVRDYLRWQSGAHGQALAQGTGGALCEGLDKIDASQ